jgi:EmrB/QacA subfamily drug resistance transporter
MTEPGLRRMAWVLIVGALAPLLDTTVVNVAIDQLGREMDAPVSAVQWVVTGYLLALSMAVPLSGWAAQRWGARKVWIASLALFVAGSVAAGLAWDIGSMIAFRVLQGVGGGLMQPIVTTLLVGAAGGRNLGRLMATVTLPAVVVPVLGPAAGGLIVGTLGWRWVFLVNVPVCLAAIALAVRYLPSVPPAVRRPRLDVFGLALLSPGLAALVYGLSEAGDRGGFSGAAVLAPLVAGAILVAGYCWHALRSPGEPLVDLRMLRVRSFAAATGLLWFSGVAMYGAMLLLPLYYQRERGFSALAAGLLLAPQGIGSLLPRTIAGRLADRIGARPVVLVGVALTALGTLAFTQAGSDTSGVLLAAGLLVRGAGMAAVTVPVLAAAFDGLPPDQVPHASGTVRIVQQLGGSFGTAVLAAILGWTGTFATAFWWAFGLTVVAALPALLLRGRVNPAAAPAARA